MALASSSDTSSRRPRTRFQMTYPQPVSVLLFHDVQPYERPRSTIAPSQPSVGQGPSTSRSPCRSFDWMPLAMYSFASSSVMVRLSICFHSV